MDVDEYEEDIMEGKDEDECGVAVSMTSPVEEGDPEGNRNSMSPCLKRRKDKIIIHLTQVISPDFQTFTTGVSFNLNEVCGASRFD